MKTYWNGEKTPARRVIVEVGPAPSGWWCASLTGTKREAVEVSCEGSVFYLDNEDGSGWDKVTIGRGSPRLGHKSLPVQRVVGAASALDDGEQP